MSAVTSVLDLVVAWITNLNRKSVLKREGISREIVLSVIRLVTVTGLKPVGV